jgi:hypothetical protein
MMRRIHQKLGTAGFVISIVALVAALGGGAYAASNGLSGKQKKEVETIARKVGKPGATGPAGATGPTGAAGPVGAAGPAGANGTDGAGVTTKTVAPSAKCPAGGTEITSASGTSLVCNGEEGEPGTTGFAAQLPSGETEMGTWAIGKFTEDQEKANVRTIEPISFAFRLTPGTYEYEFVGKGEPPKTHCKGSPQSPTADPGFLCIYETDGEGVGFLAVTDPSSPEFEVEQPSTVGANLVFLAPKKSGYMYGTWAVTSK